MKVVINPLNRWRAILLLAALLVSSVLQAGQFGKIKGTVTDIETGEPLPDANVIVLGTVPLRGASTDLDGEFMISQVLPGEYDLECQMLGYKQVTMQGVLVNLDHTTAGIDFQLPSTESKLEDVVVQAKREKIQIDRVSSTVSVSSEDLERSAVVDVSQVIQSKPGFKTDQEGAIHARGARADQAAILINGIDSRDPLVGGATYLNVDVANIKQLDILSGGFGPEYGQAQAAVIKIETVEGPRDRYTGKLEYRTDAPFGPYSFDTDGTSIAFGGPIPFTARKATGPMTFYLTARANLTNTYLPFDITREANDYTGIGFKLPERQVNDYQTTINLSIPITERTKTKLYFERYFRRWDIYPNSAAPLSGNYGYVYTYNPENRPWAENNRINMSLELLHQVNETSTFSSIISRSENKTLISPRGKAPGDFNLEFNITERNYEDAKSDFLGLVDIDGNGFFDGYVDANNNGLYDGVAFGGDGNTINSEGYEDLNRNGRWDQGEDWIDLNGNGLYDAAEPFTDVTDPATGISNIGIYDPWDPFVDVNGNGIWDDAEPQLPEQDANHNGRWDGERFQDANGNGVWDGWTEPFEDENGNGFWDEGEPYTDTNHNGRWDMAEGYDDIDQNGQINFQDIREDDEDVGEPFVDGDLYYDTGEPFIDFPNENGYYNGTWDTGEPYWDLPSSYGFGVTPFLNGKHDSTNYMFDEYELFTRWASFVEDPYFNTHDYTDIRARQGGTNWNMPEDLSMPVIYTYSLEAHGADWPVNIREYNPEYSTWINRTLHDEASPEFNEPDYEYNPGEEYFIDYNQNGTCDQGNYLETTYGLGYNPQQYYDFFLNPGGYDNEAFWQNRRSVTYNWKSEYQSQLNKYHEVLLGAQVTHREMTMSSISGPNKPYNGYVALPEGSPWPDRGQARDFYDHNPTEGALYFKDKMEFEGLFVLLGARWDFLLHENSTISEIEDAYDEGQPGAVLPERSISRLSPRLGISHPITETAKLYFNYGHFYQTPNFQYFYRSLTGNKANNQVVGNPNLKHEKTVEYQFGIEAEFNETTLINIQGFYRDIFDQISTIAVEVSRGYFIDRYMNLDYGRSRGASISYNRNTTHTVIDANYELSFAYGKASSAEAALQNRVDNQPVNRDEHPLNWDQTHSLNAYYSLFYGPGDRPELFGFKLPSDWLASVSVTYGSGRPYTPSRYTLGIDNSALILANSSRMPWTETTNLKLEKYFRFGGDNSSHKMVVGVDIQNLFNKNNVRSLYPETGSTDQVLHGKNPDHILYYPGKNTFDDNPWNYSPPRHIMLRVAYTF
jgi:outer membrane receptor protein involved in Fe transport